MRLFKSAKIFVNICFFFFIIHSSSAELPKSIKKFIDERVQKLDLKKAAPLRGEKESFFINMISSEIIQKFDSPMDPSQLKSEVIIYAKNQIDELIMKLSFASQEDPICTSDQENSRAIFLSSSLKKSLADTLNSASDEKTSKTPHASYIHLLDSDGQLTSEAVKLITQQNRNDSERTPARLSPPKHSEKFKVEQLEPGSNSEMIFRVTSDEKNSEPEGGSLILKVLKSPDCKEFKEKEQLEKIKQSDLVNLSILSKSKTTPPEELSHLLKDHPLILVHQSADTYFDAKGKRHCFITFQAAQGESLSSPISGQESKTLIEKYLTVGKALGAMHYAHAENPKASLIEMKTKVHSDLHSDNIFYDPLTKKVTLIDNADFTAGKSPETDITPFLSKILSYVESNAADTTAEKLKKNLFALQAFLKGYAQSFPTDRRLPIYKELTAKYYDPIVKICQAVRTLGRSACDAAIALDF